MQLSHKLILGFLVVTLVMGGFGFFMFQRVSSKLSDKQVEINEHAALTSAIQDFHIENYHTQLEVWEYAYQPTEKRLNAFYKHLVVFEVLFEDFIVLADEAELSAEDRTLVTDLKSGIVDVRQTWIDFVAATEGVATGTLATATLDEDGAKTYALLDEMQDYGYAYSYPMFDPASVNAFEPVLIDQIAATGGLEDVFDNANFNSNAGTFVASQQEHLADEVAAAKELKSTLTTQFAVTFAVVLGISIGIALLLTSMITAPIKRVTRAARELSNGNVHVEVPEVTSNDEIQDLADGFRSLMAAFNVLLDDSAEASKG